MEKPYLRQCYAFILFLSNITLLSINSKFMPEFPEENWLKSLISVQQHM